jgi:hypothetical protein
MILHAASIAAFFVDKLAQAPVQVQCVQQATPEPMLKWLLPTIVQTVVSLASISAGVLIAVWSFKRNRHTEYEQWIRNQKAGHEQWVRDQKKAEWRELLDAIIACELYMVIADKRSIGEILSSSHQQSETALAMLKVKHCLEDRVFIDNPKLSSIRSLWESNANKTTSGDWESLTCLLVEYQKLIKEVRETAKKDLMVVSAWEPDERKP